MPHSRRAFSSLFVAGRLRGWQSGGWKIVYRAAPDGIWIDLAVSAGAVAAVGMETARSKPVAVVWEGAWSVRTLPERPVSLFLSATAWLAAESGLWRSADLCRTWKLVHKAEGLLRVYFVTEAHGYALGKEKTILETGDGGNTWTPVAAAAEPATHASYTAYHWVEFVTPRAGIITGASRPPRSGRTGAIPAWRDPQADLRRKEWPGASLTLETRDGGLTWKHSSTSLFGRITRVRSAKDGKGLALVEFHDAFDWPSEVFSIDLRSGRSERVFRRQDRAVTDLLLFPGGRAVVAAVKPPEDPASSTLGAVHLLTTEDLTEWREMPLPEPLRAGRVWLGTHPDGTLWALLDTGIVLRRALTG
ncbi:MAG TPA: YCF48-related protein [Bryobacteraceae bacterium]|nr:YCF48-related protein [Bryobacteraceae bacterium]